MPDRIRENAVGAMIADQTPKHAPGAKRAYHGLTRGWIVNEIVRRVDPKGRTVRRHVCKETSVIFGRLPAY